MTKIYVVTREEGSYSDYSKTNLKAFYNEEDARKFVEGATQERNQHSAAYQKLMDALHKASDVYNETNPRPVVHTSVDYWKTPEFKVWDKVRTLHLNPYHDAFNNLESNFTYDTELGKSEGSSYGAMEDVQYRVDELEVE